MERPLTGSLRPDGAPLSLAEYEAAGGYQALRQIIGAVSPSDVIEKVKSSGLRGRGGAGFPTGLKWSFVPQGDRVSGPTYLVANGDEMEPGTFKDRLLVEGNPHQLIEGMIIAAYAIGADEGYIFLRWAYKEGATVIRAALAEARKAGYLGKGLLGSTFDFELYLHTSAGRYMCGEETALINSLEGRRANPRGKPPFPPVVGLWGQPTIIQNIETFCCVPPIIRNGPDWFQGLGNGADAGTKIYGASGKVRSPGLWELPIGTTMREILEVHAGGMRDGLRFVGALPGGASTDFLVEQHLDVKMDFASVEAAGSRLGTGTIIVLDDQTCPVGAIHNLIRFFAQESCGFCTPCREGLGWARQTLAAFEEGTARASDLDILDHICGLLQAGNSFCALAPGALEPLQSGLKYFRADFERHIREGGCPWR
jgi:NADH-quinone oxidoreductase subunit F